MWALDSVSVRSEFWLLIWKIFTLLFECGAVVECRSRKALDAATSAVCPHPRSFPMTEVQNKGWGCHMLETYLYQGFSSMGRDHGHETGRRSF